MTFPKRMNLLRAVFSNRTLTRIFDQTSPTHSSKSHPTPQPHLFEGSNRVQIEALHDDY